MNKFLLFLCIFLFLSCDKSKKIKKEIPGVWGISELTIVQNYSNGNSYDTVLKNFGTITYNSNGQGNYYIPGFNSESFSWTNNETSIFEISNGHLDTMKIIDCSKNRLVIEDVDNENISGNINTFIYTYILEK